jgi:hypothetical protein
MSFAGTKAVKACKWPRGSCVSVYMPEPKLLPACLQVFERPCEAPGNLAHRASIRSRSLSSAFLALAVRATTCASSCLARLSSSSCAHGVSRARRTSCRALCRQASGRAVMLLLFVAARRAQVAVQQHACAQSGF